MRAWIALRDGTQVIDPMEALLTRWEQRGDAALGWVLPAWRANSGLTDGWGEVVQAINAAAESCFLPGPERLVLRDVAAKISEALNSR